MSIEAAIKQSFPNMFRPLKWMHFDLPTDYGRGEWFAHGVRGTFHVYDSREKFPNEKPYYAKNISEMFDTLEQAQAACQTRNEGDTLIGLSPDFLSTIADLQRENESMRQRLDAGPNGEDAIDVAESAADHLRHRAEAAEAEVTRLRKGIQWCLNRDQRNGSLPGSYAEKLQSLASTGGEHHAE